MFAFPIQRKFDFTLFIRRKYCFDYNGLLTSYKDCSSLDAKQQREQKFQFQFQFFFSAFQTGVRLPEGASAALAKPTKYHYYPHNQHIYLLPECAVQQVCNAVYVRLNFTQPLCACPGRYRDPCSASLDSDDLHTTELVTDSRTKVSYIIFFELGWSRLILIHSQCIQLYYI